MDTVLVLTKIQFFDIQQNKKLKKMSLKHFFY